MSVWISDEKLLIFASLISPSKMILFEKKYQTFDTVFHHQMKHLEVRQKYSAARRIFNSLLGVSSGDETLHLMFDILHQGLMISNVKIIGAHSLIFASYLINTPPTHLSFIKCPSLFFRQGDLFESGPLFSQIIYGNSFSLNL